MLSLEEIKTINTTVTDLKIGGYIFNKNIETNYRLEISKKGKVIDLDIIEILFQNDTEWSTAYKLYHNYINGLYNRKKAFVFIEV